MFIFVPTRKDHSLNSDRKTRPPDARGHRMMWCASGSFGTILYSIQVTKCIPLAIFVRPTKIANLAHVRSHPVLRCGHYTARLLFILPHRHLLGMAFDTRYTLHSACRVVLSSNLTLVRNYTTKTTATATSGVAVRCPRPCESKIRQTQGIDKMRFILNPHILSLSSSVVGVFGWIAGTDGARCTFMCVFLVAQYLPRGKTFGKMGQPIHQHMYRSIFFKISIDVQCLILICQK